MFFQQTKPPKGPFSEVVRFPRRLGTLLPQWQKLSRCSNPLYLIMCSIRCRVYIKFPLIGSFWDNIYSFPGPFWDALSDTSFQSAAFHSPAVDDSDVSCLKSSKIIFKCFIFVFQSEDENDVFIPASM